MKINMLSKKETSSILNKLLLNWPENIIPKIKNIKAYEIEKNRKLLIHEDNFAAVLIDEVILPFLGNNNLVESFPYVLIDMGAVRYICNGANIARPGIIKFESFLKDKIVIVKDIDYQKPLAVGISLCDSKTGMALSKGHIINNMHYVGDKFWNLYKELKI
ncbi:MAG TPA: PUA domain-containing protein [Nitrososphaeraceae archaeon]|nr:PUA domain-containing protein [Nitrososphaeraceae archaeon]